MELLAQVNRDGFVFRERWEPSVETRVLAERIGEAVALDGEDPVHSLTAMEKDQAPPNTYSGNYGLGAFPLHTDLAHWNIPPRYLMLRCQVGYDAVPTFIFDGLRQMQKYDISLRRVLLKPRQPLFGEMRLLRLCQRIGDAWLLRWDPNRLQSAIPAMDPSIFHDFYFSFLTSRDEWTQIFLKDKGDTLILDNWRMVHGRGEIPAQCADRRLDRVYLRRLSS